MAWNIFSGKNKYKAVDVFQAAINTIETFAPKRYLPEREMYYYNYRQIKKYHKPLFELLTYISKRPESREDEEVFVGGHFRRLKAFYDINDTLSIKEALQDRSLKIRLLELFKMFYDDTTMQKEEMDDCLKHSIEKEEGYQGNQRPARN